MAASYFLSTVDRLPEAPSDFGEFHGVPHLPGAWSWEVDGHFFQHPAWPCGHDDDAVGEEDSLLNGVGDEEQRSRLGSDAEQYLGQDVPSERVHRGEWLVHQ